MKSDEELEKPNKILPVTKCQDCPLLIDQTFECARAYCSWNGVQVLQRGDREDILTPQWCPLKTMSVTLKFESHK
jgi:hypothetical protein